MSEEQFEKVVIERDGKTPHELGREVALKFVSRFMGEASEDFTDATAIFEFSAGVALEMLSNMHHAVGAEHTIGWAKKIPEAIQAAVDAQKNKRH